MQGRCQALAASRNPGNCQTIKLYLRSKSSWETGPFTPWEGGLFAIAMRSKVTGDSDTWPPWLRCQCRWPVELVTLTETWSARVRYPRPI